MDLTDKHYQKLVESGLNVNVLLEWKAFTAVQKISDHKVSAEFKKSLLGKAVSAKMPTFLKKTKIGQQYANEYDNMLVDVACERIQDSPSKEDPRLERMCALFILKEKGLDFTKMWKYAESYKKLSNKRTPPFTNTI
jgi:hypothetical protein